MNTPELLSKIQTLYPNIYQGARLEKLSNSVENLAPVIRHAIEHFLTTSTHLEITILGHSVQSLMQGSEQNELAAYLTLDWLIREPQKAQEVLKRGYDKVI
jgi:hypothetical protein